MNYRRAFLLVLAGLALPSRAEPLPQIDEQRYFPPSHARRIPYFERITRDAYRTVGSRNSRWDKSVEPALLIYSRFLCFDQVVAGTTNFQVMVDGLKTALAAGCDDPLVGYAGLRLKPYEVSLDPRPVREISRAIIAGLKAHPYPASLQAWMYTQAAAAALAKPPDKAQAKAWAETGVAQLAEAVAQCADREDLYAVAPQLFSVYKGAAGDRKPAYDLFAAKLAEHSAQSNEVALAMSAKFYLDWATDATHQPGASKSERMGPFIQRVVRAKELLEDAWLKDATDPYVCKQMLLALGTEFDTAALAEQWFQRGLQAGPSYYGLYAARLEVLEGSRRNRQQRAVAFGRECLKEGRWLDQIPFILLDAHLHYASTNYFQQPEVWNDLQSLHETYLKLYPDNNVVRSSYCYCAYLAERWDVASRLMAQLGNLAVPALFRGDYRKCLEAIKQHTSAKGPAGRNG